MRRMFGELGEDLRDVWRSCHPLERVLFVVFIPLYAISFFLACIFDDY